MTMRNFINLTEAFWRKPQPIDTMSIADPGAGSNAFRRDPVEYARQFSSAEEYADAMNPMTRMNTDPPDLQQRYETKRQGLMRQWEHWKMAGMLEAAMPQRIAEAIREHGFDHLRHDRDVIKALVQMYRRGFADRPI